MLAPAQPFDQHATLLCRTEEVIAKNRHAFGRDCQPVVPATPLLEHRQTVQRLLSIVDLDGPLKQVDLKQWTAQVEQLEAVMNSHPHSSALLTVGASLGRSGQGAFGRPLSLHGNSDGMQQRASALPTKMSEAG